MKSLIMIIVSGLLALTACASLDVDPTTGEVSYFRMGSQHIQGLSVTKDGDKISLKIEKQNATAQDVLAILNALGK